MMSKSLFRSSRPLHNDNAMEADYQKLFAEHAGDFHRLATLIVGNTEKAEACISAAMSDCIKGTAVTKEWAANWARYVLVKSALRILSEDQFGESVVPDSLSADEQSIRPQASSVFPEFADVFALNTFERIVFVLCTLERYSTHDCALLLGRSLRDVHHARICATEHVTVYKQQLAGRREQCTNNKRQDCECGADNQ